jgi:ubiquinone/menaquinone biosynthesis C-methylase UbiE
VTRFGPDPRAFFETVYAGEAPWDVGGAQPAMAALLAEHPPASPVLDVGCGSGDLALAMARAGHDVVGVDFAAAAIAAARAKAAALPPAGSGRAEFVIGDALRPSSLDRRFGAVVDSGFYHLFDADETTSFVAELARVLPAGGRYYLLAFAVEFPVPNVPRAVSEAELRDRFRAERGWRILALRAAEFQSRVAPVPAIAACVERSSP